MSYRFKKTESPSRSVRRLCRERIGVARSWLRKTGRASAIHNVRKEIKKVRAALRLVREEISRRDYVKTVKPLRKVAGRLAPSRDARVMLREFLKLEHESAVRFPITHEALLKHCRRETRKFGKGKSPALADRWLRKVNRRVGRLKISAKDWAMIEPGLRQSYRRGREKFKLANREPSSENFHEWRKTVKDLWHHLQMICPKQPANIRVFIDKFAMLGAQLGEEHDLHLLGQFAAESGDPKEARQLNRKIELRRKMLGAAALKLGADVFGETTLALCARPGRETSKSQARR